MFTLYLGLQEQYDDRAKCQGCVSCKSCTKPRCIYTDRNLHNREQRELKEIIRSYDYVCECLMTPDISFLFLVSCSLVWRCIVKHPLNGRITVQLKLPQEKTCTVTVPKVGQKLTKKKRNYIKLFYRCVNSARPKEKSS